jgi:hypothetical protein
VKAAVQENPENGAKTKLETSSKTTSPVEPLTNKPIDELEGKTLTPFEKARAEALSRAKPGETAVVNHIRLQSAPDGFQEKYLGMLICAETYRIYHLAALDD